MSRLGKSVETGWIGGFQEMWRGKSGLTDNVYKVSFGG